MDMSGPLAAGLWGFVGGSALLIGAGIAYAVHLPQRLIATIMAIGSGVLRMKSRLAADRRAPSGGSRAIFPTINRDDQVPGILAEDIFALRIEMIPIYFESPASCAQQARANSRDPLARTGLAAMAARCVIPDWNGAPLIVTRQSSKTSAGRRSASQEPCAGSYDRRPAKAWPGCGKLQRAQRSCRAASTPSASNEAAGDGRTSIHLTRCQHEGRGYHATTIFSHGTGAGMPMMPGAPRSR